ncbi:hypothetical protein V7S57_02190 [Caulobacter sp. CCNWLY153]|uniref:hypothetical protein n=1 Tax=Caulobacter sp. CCNWLW153 TaxID=3122396 RepID=UPI002FEFFC20
MTTRHLAADIYEALGYQVVRGRTQPKGIVWRYRGAGQLGLVTHWRTMQDFTTSIDDALGLIEKLIGRGLLSIEITHETSSPGVYPAVVLRWRPIGEPGNWHCAIQGAATVPLALMAALFEAMGRPSWRAPGGDRG